MQESQVLSMLESNYPSFIFGSWSTCAYCGDPSTVKDHVIPFSYLSSKDRKQRKSYGSSIGPQVLACSDCNGKLGSRVFEDFHQRCKFIADKLLKKAIRVAPEWENKELKSLDLNLRSYVIQKQNLKRFYYQRSSWFLSDAYFLNIESLLYEPRIQIGHPKFKEYYYRFFKDSLQRLTDCLASRKESQRCSEEYYRYGSSEES